MQVGEHLLPDIDFGPATFVVLGLVVVSMGKLMVFLWQGFRTSSDRHRRAFFSLNMLAFGLLFVPAILLNVVLPVYTEVRTPIGFAFVPLSVLVFYAAVVRYQFGRAEVLTASLEEKVRERTRALEQAQLRLVQTEKQAAMTQLVAGLAHELNTPLGAMVSMVQNAARATERLESSRADDSARLFSVLRDAHRVIGEGTERVSALVTRLKNFSRLDQAELQTVSVASGIHEVLALLDGELPSNLAIDCQLHDLPKMRCYPQKLNQLWMNLLSNAVAAMKAGGTITISSEARGTAQVVVIADQGCGMTRSELAHAFEPAFSTTGERVRARFGLAICHQIALDHGGSIELSSEPGNGTTVRVELVGASV
jgi:signal transduction histidine kinase